MLGLSWTQQGSGSARGKTGDLGSWCQNITKLGADALKVEEDTFTDDRLSPLTRWQRKQGTSILADESYSFDAFGNLTNYAGRTLPVLGTTNRLASASYDASGNVTSWGSFSYTWDVVNQMTGMQGNGLSRRFAYTAAGERMLEWDQNRYIVSVRGLAGEVLREVTYSYGASSNSWQVFWEKDTVWAGGRLLASVSRTEGIQHYHVDHLGSPRMVTNHCGQRMKTFDHNPWGMDRFAGMQYGERHRFTAHQRDVGNLTRSWDDVDYMHARYYTGYLARFLSPDPVRGDAPRPQSFNLFSYVVGNPVNSVDPDGRAANFLTTSREQAMARVAEELRLFESLAVWQALFEPGPSATVTLYAGPAIAARATVAPGEVEAARQSILDFLQAPGVMESIRNAFYPFIERNALNRSTGREASGYIIRVRSTGAIVFRFSGASKPGERDRVTFSLPRVDVWDYLAVAHTHPWYDSRWPSSNDIASLKSVFDGQIRFMLVFHYEGVTAYDKQLGINLEVVAGSWW